MLVAISKDSWDDFIDLHKDLRYFNKHVEVTPELYKKYEDACAFMDEVQSELLDLYWGLEE